MLQRKGNWISPHEGKNKTENGNGKGKVMEDERGLLQPKLVSSGW
jgi:hypothetical protein